MTGRPDQEVMTNPRAERVRSVARLAGRSARLRAGAFLVEGPQGCREALRAHLGRGPAKARSVWPAGGVVREVYVSDRLAQRDPELAALVDEVASLRPSAAGLSHDDGRSPSGRRVAVRRASDEVLTAMSDAVTGQGILIVAALPQAMGLDQVLTQGRVRLAAVLCRVQDPGNAGTILRAADAAGADAVLLTTGSVDLFNPKVVRSTAGSIFHLPVVTGLSLDASVDALRRAGLQVWAADGHADHTLTSLASETLGSPTAWLLGNEARGLSETERALADQAVAVPLYGAAESLNVGTAATVCLYASAMAARRAG
ncbi:RNA methyltransferase [Micrococcus sp. HMSC067E09]|nr:TrmH family RNA methyltransferase [Micrococcus sp. HMSC067E09]OFR86909.1 RNA methyltransferase [Micrococcus sp. HMSC067E09]